MSQMPRVRFAPSPTGYLHVGGARTALFNWLFARHTGGAFVLRIEDTDRERSRSELTEAILDGLSWLGIDWDEGPYHQADNVERHRADARALKEAGAAYRCFCPAERLETLRAEARVTGTAAAYDGHCREIPAAESERRAGADEPHALRFRIPTGVTAWDDVVGGTTRFQNTDIEDFVIMRSDFTPTYNLAVVSDDIAMGITHVIRGADHISNTPKQINIYQALNVKLPTFGHVPLILGSDGKRLSKRHGATSVSEYRARGLLAEAVVNFLALLGWSPGDDQEVMDTKELVARFTLDRINRKPAIFDHEKLEWLNGQYLSQMSGTRIAAMIEPLIIEAGVATGGVLQGRQDWLSRVADSLKTRSKTLRELAERARPFFPGPVRLEPEAAAKHWKDRAAVGERLRRLHRVLSDVTSWEEAELEGRLRELAEDMQVGAGKIIHPLRVALTGSAVSPGIFELMKLMGRDLVLERITAAISHLDGA